ncbi:holo-[acyl-carrier-protein] synthase [Alkalispirochaeta americana]|uniref:Holo-[acyl-carrier-protein] synthase n=1 Tax=Alkalispirochaeta americana TaxID=159291 RepID=A0A1N6VMU1_9SPIO|nr:holo-ACP synthase [Alkalispirochaeta americana]SIQ79172.1 holo-[acyl-carrier-protein] synthase [Alkalispirochaeta americana]
MIRGIGVDVVAVDRLRPWLDDQRLLKRYFARQERDAIYQRRDGAALSLAARFAAKEAFAKALGTGFRGFQLREVWVVNDPLGKPELHVSGGAARALSRVGGTRLWLSLTHEQAHAIAMVVIEG